MKAEGGFGLWGSLHALATISVAAAAAHKLRPGRNTGFLRLSVCGTIIAKSGPSAPRVSARPATVRQEGEAPQSVAAALRQSSDPRLTGCTLLRRPMAPPMHKPARRVGLGMHHTAGEERS